MQSRHWLGIVYKNVVPLATTKNVQKKDVCIYSLYCQLCEVLYLWWYRLTGKKYWRKWEEQIHPTLYESHLVPFLFFNPNQMYIVKKYYRKKILQKRHCRKRNYSNKKIPNIFPQLFSIERLDQAPCRRITCRTRKPFFCPKSEFKTKTVRRFIT